MRFWRRIKNMIYKNYRFDIPNYVKYVIDVLESHDQEVYVVGGSIRDKLIGRSEESIHDYDLVTNADPEDTYRIFASLDKDKYSVKITTTGMIHNTLKIWLDNYEPIDVTMFGNNPMFVDPDIAEMNSDYESDIKDDLSRRDFTMNALAYNPNSGLIDMYNGVKDIRHKNLKFIGSVSSRLNKDPFLILRAIRQSIILNFKMDYITQHTVFNPDYLTLLNTVSGWRRGSELRKILSFDKELLNMLSRAYLKDFCNEVVRYLFNDSYIHDNIVFKFDKKLITNCDTSESRIAYLFRNIPIRMLKKILLQEFEYELSFVDSIIEISWRYHKDEY